MRDPRSFFRAIVSRGAQFHCGVEVSHAIGKFHSGDQVTVRSPEEILSTLDADGTLDGLPFMPEMLEWCGKSLRVERRAEKTCVSVPLPAYGNRRFVPTTWSSSMGCGVTVKATTAARVAAWSSGRRTGSVMRAQRTHRRRWAPLA